MTPEAAFGDGNVVAILAMAAATFACRAGGYWLFRLVTPTPLLRSVLAYIPGTLFVSFVVPALAEGGVVRWAGGAATLAIMALTRSLVGAIFGGTAVAWAVWSLTA